MIDPKRDTLLHNVMRYDAQNTYPTTTTVFRRKWKFNKMVIIGRFELAGIYQGGGGGPPEKKGTPVCIIILSARAKREKGKEKRDEG